MADIDADADQIVAFFEESAPFIIQFGAVVLDSIDDLLFRPPVLLSVFNRALEEIQPHQGRFTTLPGDVDFRYLVCLQELASSLLRCFSTEPMHEIILLLF